MQWLEQLVEQLAREPCGGYGGADSAATEPSALAALALARAEQWDAVRRVANWLVSFQSSDGSTGVRPTERQPSWPTSLAVLTWGTILEGADRQVYQQASKRAVGWMLSHQGAKIPADEVRGHDGTLAAWPWVDDTHAWVEPTSLHVLALKSVGHTDHPRTRSAVAMLFDRQLPSGGFNYGNTFVLGQQLRPHVQPTGLALLALAGEPGAEQQVSQSLEYLVQQVGRETTTASLAWGLLALTAFDRRPSAAEEWLKTAYERVLQRGAAHHKLALIALARLCDSPPRGIASHGKPQPK